MKKRNAFKQYTGKCLFSLVLGFATIFFYSQNVVAAELNPQMVNVSVPTEPQRIITGQIVVDSDYMEGFRLKNAAGQIVIGNPIVADVIVRDDQYIFISGKSAGRTNMLVYGKDGDLKERYVIMVRDSATYLTLYKGAENRAHYDCLPYCQRVLSMQDSSDENSAQLQKISSNLTFVDERANKSATREQEQLERLKQSMQQ
jgi:hypothetical protein